MTTKIHVLADRRCRPLVRLTTAGQRHDSVAFQPVLRRLRIARRGPGRPRTRPHRLLADKAYSNRTIRGYLRQRRIKTTIPQKADQIAHRVRQGSKGGRPPAFDPVAYRDRNTVERAFNKLKAFRAIALRTDKRDYIYRGTIDIATIKIWLRDPTRHDPSDTPWCDTSGVLTPWAGAAEVTRRPTRAGSRTRRRVLALRHTPYARYRMMEERHEQDAHPRRATAGIAQARTCGRQRR